MTPVTNTGEYMVNCESKVNTGNPAVGELRIGELERTAVARTARRMWSDGLVRGTAGNVSARLRDDSGLVAVTPTSVAYETLTPADIAVVTLDGDVVDGERSPTSELMLHTVMYSMRPDVHGVVHTHSPTATAAAVAQRGIPPILVTLVAVVGGDVACATYAKGTTREMVDFTIELLAERSACLLANHGVLAIGPTLAEAYAAAETVEWAADVFQRAEGFGGAMMLDDAEIERIRGKWKARWGR